MATENIIQNLTPHMLSGIFALSYITILILAIYWENLGKRKKQ